MTPDRTASVQVATLADAVAQLQAGVAAAAAAAPEPGHGGGQSGGQGGGGLARQLSLAETLRAELGDLRERLLGAAASADERLAGDCCQIT